MAPYHARPYAAFYAQHRRKPMSKETDMVAMTWRARTIAALQSAMIERLKLTMRLLVTLPRMAMAPPFCDTVRA